MEWWQIFGIIFLICGAVWVYSSFAEAARNRKPGTLTVPLTRDNMLQRWDEKEIALELNKLQTRPSLLVHYVESVRQRFIERQDVKTAAVRIAFLEKQVSLLRLANEYTDLKNELSLKAKKFNNEAARVDLENQSIRLGFKDENTERRIQELENEARLIEQELKLTKLKKELDALSNPPQPERKLSNQEIREEKRQNIKSRIQKLNEMIVETRNDSTIGESERQATLNQLERKKFDLNEELLDLI
jgi:hypothetical protein